MTRDDIISMAREAGLTVCRDEWVFGEMLERFTAIVAAAERQRLHDRFMEMHKSQQHSNNYWHFAARKIMEES